MASQSRSIALAFLMASALAMGGIPACGDAGTHAAQQTGKPDDKKPAEGSKPDAAKPGDKKDGEKPKDDGKTRNGNELLDIEVGGKKFKLELAITPDVRMKGLGQRNQIEAEGGMLFVFKDSDVRVQKFVMRDCPVDIDIIYLDGAGRVTAMYQMKAEKPRAADGSEGKIGDINMDDPKSQNYEKRLPSYSSRFNSQYVIELKGGTIPSLKLKETDKIEADWAGLKKRAK